ncbi:hypothetical protein [Ottowia thiooxydans]
MELNILSDPIQRGSVRSYVASEATPELGRTARARAREALDSGIVMH